MSESNKKAKSKIKELKVLYRPIKPKIEARLREFENQWNKGSEEDIFAELVFCLLTPQSKARSCDSAVCMLLENDVLIKGTQKEIAGELRTKTRFHNNKAGYVVEARKMFTKKGKMRIKERIIELGDPQDARHWFAENVKGLGLKETSHFLRNIGMGGNLAILDRHILKNLVSLDVISEFPKSLNEKRYFDIEKKMIEFSKKIKIPPAHLDLLLWYKETGEVFK